MTAAYNIGWTQVRVRDGTLERLKAFREEQARREDNAARKGKEFIRPVPCLSDTIEELLDRAVRERDRKAAYSKRRKNGGTKQGS